MDVNAILGVGCDVGYGRCEQRIEGIVQCTKNVLYNIKKMKKSVCVCGGGGGGGVGGGAIFEPKTLSMYLKKERKKCNKNK